MLDKYEPQCCGKRIHKTCNGTIAGRNSLKEFLLGGKGRDSGGCGPGQEKHWAPLPSLLYWQMFRERERVPEVEDQHEGREYLNNLSLGAGLVGLVRSCIQRCRGLH